MKNLHVQTSAVSPEHNCVMELVIAKIIRRLMKAWSIVQQIELVMVITSNAILLTSVWNPTGFVMETMIVVIIQMKILHYVLKELVHQTALGKYVYIIFSLLIVFFYYL